MVPTPGRIVHYRLSHADAEQANRRRDHARKHMELHLTAANGTQVHVGNHHSAGDVVPLLVVRVWDNEFNEGSPFWRDMGAEAPDISQWPKPKSNYGINGQAFLDGNDTLWITSAPQAAANGCWDWPERV